MLGGGRLSGSEGVEGIVLRGGRLSGSEASSSVAESFLLKVSWDVNSLVSRVS